MKTKKYSFFERLFGMHIKKIYLGTIPIDRRNIITGNSLGEIEMALYKTIDDETNETTRIYAAGDGSEIDFQVEPFLESYELILK